MDANAFTLQAHELSTAWKTRAVKKTGADTPVPFIVIANRGSEHVATFFPTGRDEMLWCTRLAVGAFGCDLVAGTVDAYQVVDHRKREEASKLALDAAGLPADVENMASHNPDTGQPWAPGEMAKAFALGRPWVRENMMTHSVDKAAQEIRMVSQTYTARHHKITWDKVDGPLLDGTEFKAGGLVPDALREALTAPDMLLMMDKLVGKDAFDLSPLERRAHCDVVAIRFAAAQQIAVAYNVSDPDTRGIVEMSLGDDKRNAEFGVPGLRLETLIPGL